MALEEQLIDLKVNLNLKGQILLNTWTEITSLLDTYQAKLAVKETQAKVRYENTSKGDMDKLRKDMSMLKYSLAMSQREITEKDNTIFKLRTDLARVQSKLILTQQRLDTTCPSDSNDQGMDLTTTQNDRSPDVRVKVEQGEDEDLSRNNGNSPQSDSWEIRNAETSSVVLQVPTASTSGSKRKGRHQDYDMDSYNKACKTEPGDTSLESDMSMTDSNNSFYQGERLDESGGAKTDTAFCLYPTGDDVMQAEGTNLVIHAREQIPATEKIHRPRRRCHLCYSQGKRKDTRFYCPACPRQPAFCNDPCFEIYHSKLCKVSIPQGENPTMAIKREFLKGDLLVTTDGASNYSDSPIENETGDPSEPGSGSPA